MTMRKIATVVAMLLAGTAASQSQGLNGTPEFREQQAALEKTYPQLNVTDEYMRLSIPGYTMGQTMGVSTNSKGHLFVYSRTNPQGIARGALRRCCGNSTRTENSSRNGLPTITPLLSRMRSGSTGMTMSGRSMKARA